MKPFYKEDEYQWSTHQHHTNLNKDDANFKRLVGHNTACGFIVLDGEGITSFMEIIGQTYLNTNEIKIYINEAGWDEGTPRFEYMHSIAMRTGCGTVPTLEDVVRPENQRKYSVDELLGMLSYEITEVRSKHLPYSDTLQHHNPITVFIDDTSLDCVGDFLQTFGDVFARCKINIVIDGRSLEVRQFLSEFKQNYVLIGSKAVNRGNTFGLARKPSHFNLVHALVVEYTEDVYFILVPIPALYWVQDEGVYKNIPLLIGCSWYEHLKQGTVIKPQPVSIKLSKDRFYQFPDNAVARPERDYMEGASVLVTSLSLSSVLDECSQQLRLIGGDNDTLELLLDDSFRFTTRSLIDNEAILTKSLRWVMSNAKLFFEWCDVVLQLRTPRHELYKLFSLAALDDPTNIISEELRSKLKAAGFPASRDSVSSLLKIQSSIANQLSIRTDYYIRKTNSLAKVS